MTKVVYGSDLRLGGEGKEEGSVFSDVQGRDKGVSGMISRDAYIGPLTV